MKDIAEFSEIEVQLHMALDALSNGESIEVNDEWIEQAGEEFKAAIRKQMDNSKRAFGLRMSNIGKPLCILQLEHQGVEPTQRRSYNHIVRMLIGDAVESIMRLAIKAAKLNITAEAEAVKLTVGDTVIPGTDDIEIDGAIWDVKSCSPYAFLHKWQEGWEGLYHHDSFGYVSQLFGYAKARNKPMGGWFVVDKSSGEVKVVAATPTPIESAEIEQSMSNTECVIRTNAPFEKLFSVEMETFKKVETGNQLVPMVCTFCDFLHHCWPEAVQRPQVMSKAQDRKVVWYASEPKVPL